MKKCLFACAILLYGCSNKYYITHILNTHIHSVDQDSVLNVEYRNQLIDISEKSFSSRQEIFNIFKIYGFNSPEAKNANVNLIKSDSVLLARFVLLENKYGWPLKSNLKSSKALNGAFVAIDHSNPIVIEKYLFKFKVAARVGESDDLFYPTLKDRLLISKNRKQIYGTQSNGRDLPDGTFEQYMLPVKNYKKLDKIRVKVGLDSILPELRKGTLIYK